MNEMQFKVKIALLTNKLSALWLFTFISMKNGMTPETMEMIETKMREANAIHAEMFPDFEHSLYSDDYISMVEGNEEA